MKHELLRQAVSEIRGLRRSNEILSAQVGVIEVFAAALGMRQNGGMMAEDLVWRIEQELAKEIPTNPTSAA
jgi:hypothetical protein